MFTIPTQGDDVPADTRALLDVSKLITYLVNTINSDDISATWLKAVILLEAIASHGGLLARFNQHLNVTLQDASGPGHTQYSVDKFYDLYVWPLIIAYFREHDIYIDRIAYRISDNPSISSGVVFVSPRRFIELLRRNEWVFDETDIHDLTLYVGSMYSSSSTDPLDPFNNYINIEPLVSYQLACAQFGTNDFVDFIYSAKLYRDNMQSLAYGNRPFPTFIYNGITFQYDVFSCRVFNDLIRTLDNEDSFDYFINLFSYVPSLRYGDYFTGAKPQPLAVGEYSAKVNNNEVSAIDITRSIQMQRLLNRVNMVGRKLGDYLTGIFGGKLPEAPKDVPVFLAHESFDIQGFETNNTGDAQLADDVQNITTTNLRTKDGRFAFEIEIDEPCYIIGMNSYESMRIYSRTMDRFAFHHDRYDDFIPEMQYIGDQEIYSKELDSIQGSDVPFGYCLRYMEYKQRYSYASGGFIENLPSWSFITDNNDGNPFDKNINPDYIRSSPSEFDRFYKSLTGYSLGSYFHFIVAHTNITSPARMMEYTPEILK